MTSPTLVSWHARQIADRAQRKQGRVRPLDALSGAGTTSLIRLYLLAFLTGAAVIAFASRVVVLVIEHVLTPLLS